jgi:hypothetical protein
VTDRGVGSLLAGYTRNPYTLDRVLAGSSVRSDPDPGRWLQTAVVTELDRFGEPTEVTAPPGFRRVEG